MGRRSTTPETPPEDETPEEPEVTEVRVLSTIHPNLLITAPKVEFADGSEPAEVMPRVLEACRKVESDCDIMF